MRNFVVGCILALVVTIGADGAFAAELTCSFSTNNKIGDYNDPQDADYLKVVNKGHFNSDVENLIRGTRGAADPMGDIRYTLRRIPNHHRALYAMSRYYFLNYERYLRKGFTSPDCYFRRATAWRERDGVVWLLYGIHLHKDERYAESVERYQGALDLMPHSAETHYNLGLAYVELGELESARDAAIEAYQRKYPLPGLKNKLKRKGMWTLADEQLIAGQDSSGAASAK